MIEQKYVQQTNPTRDSNDKDMAAMLVKQTIEANNNYYGILVVRNILF